MKRKSHPALWATIHLALIPAFLVGLRPVMAQTLPNGVAAGDVNQTSVVLWARSLATGPIEFAYGPEDAGDDLVVTTSAVDSTIPVKVELENLTPATRYIYTVTNSAGQSESGVFRTPAEDGFHGLRFGVSGDWRGELAPYPAISNIPDRDLDFFIALGDTVYSDVPSIDLLASQARTLEEFRIKHNEVYRTRFGHNYWAVARASTAFFAMWDDHEVTNDFSGGAHPSTDARFDQTGPFINETELFRNALQVFQEFNPIRDERYGQTGDPRTAGKAKLYRYRTFGSDAAIFLLDTRSFRDAGLRNVYNPFARRALSQFVRDSFDPDRTMLGAVQFDDLISDLMDAQLAGITWKFIMVPEPIQNLSPLVAADRYEGYAYERTRILRFINEIGITDVVFIAADVHSMFVNNVTYQLHPAGRQRPTGAFEITTGPVAYAAPFGPTVLQYAPLGILTRLALRFFTRLTAPQQNAFLTTAGNRLLEWFGYSPLGLQCTSIDAELIEGPYAAVNAYSWTEFEIDADTQTLTVTTHAIPWYDELDLFANPDAILAREPSILSQFAVIPVFEPEVPFDRQLRGPSLCGSLGTMGLLWPLLALPLLIARLVRSRR